MKYHDKPWSCAVCHYKMDAMTSVDGGPPPKEGDISMCLSCGTLYERRKDTWVQLTPDEIKALPADLRAYLGKAKRLRQKIVREDLVLNQKLEDL